MKTGRPKVHGERLLGNGLTPSMWQWLQEEAGRQGVNRTELLRRIVTAYRTSKENANESQSNDQ